MTCTQTADYFHEELGVPLSSHEISKEIISYVADAYKNTIPLKPFAREFLEKEFLAGTKMCILTAGDISFVSPALERLDLLKYFQFVMTCSSQGKYKDQKEIFEIAMDKLGGTTESTVVFEDALYAIQGAQSAGLRVYAIQESTTLKDDKMIQEIADVYIESYSYFL